MCLSANQHKINRSEILTGNQAHQEKKRNSIVFSILKSKAVISFRCESRAVTIHSRKKFLKAIKENFAGDKSQHESPIFLRAT